MYWIWLALKGLCICVLMAFAYHRGWKDGRDSSISPMVHPRSLPVNSKVENEMCVSPIFPVRES